MLGGGAASVAVEARIAFLRVSDSSETSCCTVVADRAGRALILALESIAVVVVASETVLRNRGPLWTVLALGTDLRHGGGSGVTVVAFWTRLTASFERKRLVLASKTFYLVNTASRTLVARRTAVFSRIGRGAAGIAEVPFVAENTWIFKP